MVFICISLHLTESRYQPREACTLVLGLCMLLHALPLLSLCLCVSGFEFASYLCVHQAGSLVPCCWAEQGEEQTGRENETKCCVLACFIWNALAFLFVCGLYLDGRKYAD